MVIQQLQTIKALLEQDPPNVNAAKIEVLLAIEKERQDYRKDKHTTEALTEIDFDFKGIVRPNDEILKEFGW